MGRPPQINRRSRSFFAILAVNTFFFAILTPVAGSATAPPEHTGLAELTGRSLPLSNLVPEPPLEAIGIRITQNTAVRGVDLPANFTATLFAIRESATLLLEVATDEGATIIKNGTWGPVTILMGGHEDLNFSFIPHREGNITATVTAFISESGGPSVLTKQLGFSIGDINKVWEVVSDSLSPSAGAMSTGTSNYGEGTLPARTAKVILLHGIDFHGPDYGFDSVVGYFGKLQQTLQPMGWASDGFIYPGFYECDIGISPGHMIDGHGDHAKHYGGPVPGRYPGDSHNGACSYPSNYGVHDGDTPIEHLAYHFAWYLYDRTPGECVKIVAHSMGGLIIRYALQKVEEGHADFPSHLCVDDVITVGTPHAGALPAELPCNNKQCAQMDPDHSFILNLGGNLNPQGSGGTEWTAIGAKGDWVVPWHQAIGNFDPEHEIVYEMSTWIIDHSTYFNYNFTDASAAANFWDNVEWGTEYFSPRVPWPNHMIDRHLAARYTACGRSTGTTDTQSPANLPWGAKLLGEYYSLGNTKEFCWYRRIVEPGVTFTVELSPQGDSDLYVYDGAIPSYPDSTYACRPYLDGAGVAEACTLTNSGTTSKTYYIRVKDWDTHKKPFFLRVYRQNDCDRGFDAPGSAQALPIKTGRINCKGKLPTGDDHDYYSLRLEKGETLTVTMTPNAAADFNLCYIHPDGNSACLSYGGVGGTESFTTPVATGSVTWKIGVTAPALAPRGTFEYALSVRASLLLKDHDDTSEWTMTMNYGDDTAKKMVAIPHKSLHWAKNPTLYVFAQAQGPCNTGNSHRFTVNGITQQEFNPCNVWSTTGFAYRPFSLAPWNLKSMVDPTQYSPFDSTAPHAATTFAFKEFAGDWTERNILFGIDRSIDQANTHAVENCWSNCPRPDCDAFERAMGVSCDIYGGFMWYLTLDIERP